MTEEESRQRLDMLLAERDLAPSRAQAQALIKSGRVRSGDKILTKASQRLPRNTELTVAPGQEGDWVGRGALKLIAALDHFGLSVTDRTVLDLGASTGGFTQVCLKRGAKRVYAVDVGHGQLHPTVAEDGRVVAMEGVNARYLSKADMPEAVDMIVCDVSFISLEKLLPNPLELAAPGCLLVALIKPQFEVGKGHVGKGGVVRSPEKQAEVCKNISDWLSARPGWRVLDVIPSPIEGSDGNREFLIAAQLAADAEEQN